MNLEEIRARLTEVGEEMVTIGDNPEPSEEDLARFNELATEFDSLTAKQTEAEARAAKVEEVRAMASKPGRTTPVVEVSIRDTEADIYDLSTIRTFAPDSGKNLRDRALKAIDRADMPAEHKAQAARLIERHDTRDGKLALQLLATGSDAYMRGWSKAVTGKGFAMTGEESEAVQRAMSLTTTAGGFAIPFTLDPTWVLTSDGYVNPVRQLARVVQVVTDDWNGISTAGVTASHDAEAAEVSDDAPTLAQPSISVHKAQAFIPVSIEASEDIPNLAGELTRLFRDAKDDLESEMFTTGSGSGQPFGVVAAITATTNSRVAATTNDAYGLVDVYNTLEGLPPRFRKNATWMANLNIINDTRQFATANNYHGFLTDLAGDTPARLLGKPLYENSDMDGTIGTGDDDVLLVGDFSNYVIVDRVGMSIEYIPHLFHTSNNRPSGQRGWYAYWRYGADSINDAAFSCLRV